MLLSSSSDFSLKDTFECGQAFRFTPYEDQSYRGVFQNTVLTLRQIDEGIEVEQVGQVLSAEKIVCFLDLGKDYSALRAFIILQDAALEEATGWGSGIRLLKQEPFEALVSFILSSNSNMKRIQTHIEKLSTLYGSPIGTLNGKAHYAFPTLEQLKPVTLEEYQKIGLGYRAAYLAEAIEKIVDLDELKAFEVFETEELIERLQQFKGIGEKVAACVALFGFGRHDAFPIDIWIKRYFQWELHKETWTLKQMARYAKDTFGVQAGLAQQYMFYFMILKHKGQ